MREQIAAFYARARADGWRGELRVRAIGAVLVLLAVILWCGGSAFLTFDGTPVGEHHGLGAVVPAALVFLIALTSLPVGGWLLVAGAGVFAASLFRRLAIVILVGTLAIDAFFGLTSMAELTQPAPDPSEHHGGGFDWD